MVRPWWLGLVHAHKFTVLLDTSYLYVYLKAVVPAFVRIHGAAIHISGEVAAASWIGLQESPLSFDGFTCLCASS